MSIDFKYKPEGDTLKKFMKSDDFFRGMRGPVGSGKSVACCIEIFRRALLQAKNKEDPIKIFNSAITNVKPNLEVRSRRVGGATYQVPVEVKANRGQALALRWLMDATRKRKNKTMAEKLYFELLDASQNKGLAIKKREDVHKMAESNKAFAHFRW